MMIKIKIQLQKWTQEDEGFPMVCNFFHIFVWIYSGSSRSKQAMASWSRKKKEPRLKMNIMNRDFHGFGYLLYLFCLGQTELNSCVLFGMLVPCLTVFYILPQAFNQPSLKFPGVKGQFCCNTLITRSLTWMNVLKVACRTQEVTLPLWTISMQCLLHSEELARLKGHSYLSLRRLNLNWPQGAQNN